MGIARTNKRQFLNSRMGLRLHGSNSDNSLKGLSTFNPGRRKSLSFPVTIVRSCRRAVAAM